jgi:hypothetical protein
MIPQAAIMQPSDGADGFGGEHLPRSRWKRLNVRSL